MDEDFLQLFDRNIKGKFSYVPRLNPLMIVKNIGNIILIDSGLNSTMFNIIYTNGTTDTASLEKALNYLNEKKLPYAFWIGFESDPTWLEQELINHGLITDETEWAMQCKLDESFTHSESVVKEVNDLEGIQAIIEVMKGIMPPEEHAPIQSFYEQNASFLLSKDCSLTYFVGYENNKPVSLSSLFCDKNTASIFDVIVLPHMRGKGLGKIMTKQAMYKAKEKSLDSCILTATNDARYLYEKLGFKVLKTMKVYQKPVNNFT